MGITPEVFIEGNSRPVRRNPLITRTLYYSKDMESFATGLKRICTACKEAGCRVEFEQQAYGFAVVFYRREKDDMWGKSQDTPQDTPQDTHTAELMKQILLFCREAKSKKEIMGYKDSKHFSDKYLNPLIMSGKLALTIPEKPRSRYQKYISNFDQ